MIEQVLSITRADFSPPRRTPLGGRVFVALDW
jgi:hypothetical protein